MRVCKEIVEIVGAQGRRRRGGARHRGVGRSGLGPVHGSAHARGGRRGFDGIDGVALPRRHGISEGG